MFGWFSQAAVAKDEQTQRDACKTMFECDILTALNDIIYRGKPDRVKWQAAVLMKLLAMHGPTKNVCVAMKAKDYLRPPMYLRDAEHCGEVRFLNIRVSLSLF